MRNLTKKLRYPFIIKSIRILLKFYENGTISSIDTTVGAIKNCVGLHKSWKQRGRATRSMVGAFFMVMYSPQATGCSLLPIVRGRKLHAFIISALKYGVLVLKTICAVFQIVVINQDHFKINLISWYQLI